MIIFRTDVSLKIGTGHVVRCLSLAKELRRRGKRCIFICRDNKDELFSLIKDEKFELILLPILKDKKKIIISNQIIKNLNMIVGLIKDGRKMLKKQ